MVKYAVLATLMLLAIGLGSFQYWAVSVQETASAEIGSVHGKVTITPGDPSPILISNIVPWRPFTVGNTSHHLYRIDFPAEYNGYYIVTLHLVNADDVANDLRYLIMNVSLYNGTYSNNNLVDSKWLSLTNGRVQFKISPSNITGGNSGYIYITDGVGKALWWKVGTVTNPQFVIDVEEIGAGL